MTKRQPSFITRALGAVLLAAMLAAVALPAQASALTVAKCTARPNADASSEVLGGKETRITFEVQASADEALKGITLTLPAGTTFGTDDAKITMLSGDNMMTRTKIKADIVAEGQSVVADFDETAEAGGYFRLEVYEVFFSTSGGDMELTGTYTLSDGTTKEISGIPAITVTSVSAVDGFVSYLEEQPWVQAWNSNTFLRLFLNPPILVRSFPIVFSGFLMALAVVLVAFPLAIPVGILLSLMRLSKSRLLRVLASIYVNLVRGTPAFLQIYIAFFGLPLAGIQIDSYILGVIVMALNSSAYLCEIFRAGIQSIPKGQTEAARSLGMSSAQTTFYIIMPQMFRNVIPTMTSEFILLYKDTSLLAAVGVMEVVMYAKTIVASTGSITPYVVAAIFYLIVTLPLARVVNVLEQRLLYGGGRKRKGPKADDNTPEVAEVSQTPAAHESGM